MYESLRSYYFLEFDKIQKLPFQLLVATTGSSTWTRTFDSKTAIWPGNLNLASPTSSEQLRRRLRYHPFARPHNCVEHVRFRQQQRNLAVLLSSLERHDAVVIIVETFTAVELEVALVQRTYTTSPFTLVNGEESGFGLHET
jgi:hypothetical protein